MNKKYSTARGIAALLLVMLLGVTVMTSCVSLSGFEDLEPRDFDLSDESEESREESDEIPTPDGYTAAPTVIDIINISPYSIAVFGSCEEGATVRIKGAAEDVETTANGTYYIINAELSRSKMLLKITAQAEGKEESLEREFVANYDATADTRLDGNSVSVGVGSRLYFDKAVDCLSGKNLFSSSDLSKIRNYITDTIAAYYYDRAAGQKAELIVCLIPNKETVYPELIPEGVYEPSSTTIYDQIAETLGNTRATVVDMRDTFMALRDDESVAAYGGLYRVTDSSMTDYAAYLTYKAIVDVISARFPDAAAHDISEFRAETVTALGGNLVNYRGFDKELITEEIVRLIPQFSLRYGENITGSSVIADLRKYVDKDVNDYNYFTTQKSDDGVSGIAERWLIDTKRNNDEVLLPSALIYRDYASLSFIDILAERFEKVLLVKSGEFNVNLSNAMQYKKSDDDNVVDYVIMIISEDSMDTAFSLTLSN
ncbi:MAG: hypothetical protein J5793_01400 [Clostridia bacterium]|nr:hypothetical protein [Clostridia bacterium]